MTGNLIEARWVARLADQLGSFTAELVHPSAALAMDDPLSLAVLMAACAVAGGALPERQAQPRIFQGLLHLLARLGADPQASLAELALWEVAVLAELGYGLDLSACALTGRTGDLAFVSPRTGRAVTREAAGAWTDRLLRLPAFLRPDAEGEPAPTPEEAREALALTAHFLARDAFGTQNRELPQARSMLQDRLKP